MPRSGCTVGSASPGHAGEGGLGTRTQSPREEAVLHVWRGALTFVLCGEADVVLGAGGARRLSHGTAVMSHARSSPSLALSCRCPTRLLAVLH